MGGTIPRFRLVFPVADGGFGMDRDGDGAADQIAGPGRSEVKPAGRQGLPAELAGQ